MNVIDEAEDLRIDLKVEINRKNYMSETSFWIVNTFLDNFFKVNVSVFGRCQIV